MQFRSEKLTIGRVLHGLYNHLVYKHYKTAEPYLYRLYQSRKIIKIRKKEKIRVLFIIAELSAWKTEALYLKMLSNPRFVPILGITESQEVPGSKEPLEAYLKSKGYSYVDLDMSNNSIEKIEPDIKLYYKPYQYSYRPGLFFNNHMRSLVCHISYGFTQGGTPLSFYHSIWRYSWKAFVENELVVETAKSIGGIYTDNMLVTGIPMQDQLICNEAAYHNPWRSCGNKKKIIYAPHHSLKGTNGNFIEYSTFLEFGDLILSLAKKYSDKTQWAFKPHPTLYSKLVKIWGKEKTASYYEEWTNLENSQLELGEYVGLFKHSDAMIHDCASFMVEYMFTGNPVLYLEESTQTAEQLKLGSFGYEAYKCHYHGTCKEQIERFINDVITDIDTKKSQRQNFYNEYLIPPHGQSASDNIIEAILGVGNYKTVR